MTEQMPCIFERKILRIYGPIQDKGRWRRRWNSDHCNLSRDLNIVFNFHGSIHHHIYFELIKTSFMQLFSVLLHFFFRSTCFGCNSSILRSIGMYMQVVQESARVLICSPARLVQTLLGLDVPGNRSPHVHSLVPPACTYRCS